MAGHTPWKDIKAKAEVRRARENAAGVAGNLREALGNLHVGGSVSVPVDDVSRAARLLEALADGLSMERERVAFEAWAGLTFLEGRDDPSAQRVWQELEPGAHAKKRAYQVADRILGECPLLRTPEGYTVDVLILDKWEPLTIGGNRILDRDEAFGVIRPGHTGRYRIRPVFIGPTQQL